MVDFFARMWYDIKKEKTTDNTEFLQEYKIKTEKELTDFLASIEGVGEVKVVCMKGRVHYYEGYDITDVVLPIRLMKMMGAKILFLTNAAGGVNFDYHAGDFMLISDQICMAPSPLIGENVCPMRAYSNLRYS